jgi:hypothetical protein
MPGGTQKLVIRWESAAPLLDAESRGRQRDSQQAIAGWAADFYVISVSGLPAPGSRGGAPNQQDAQGTRGPMGPEGMKAGTALKRKGRNPIAPARVETIQTEKGAVIAFLFPHTDAIDADDKEVTFESGLGPLGIKCKFVLKEMTYRGKLAL